MKIFVGGEKGVLTDAGGRFEFTGLAPGSTAVRAQKPGFFSEEDEGGQFVAPRVVTIGSEAPSVVVKLVPEAVITGRILSEGTSVENIPVTLTATRVRDGRREIQHQANVASEEDGEFRIANLHPGTYYLAVGPQWRGNAVIGIKDTQERGYRETFYQSGESLESATPLVVAAGQKLEADVTVKLEPYYHIRGVVRNVEGLRAVNVFLMGAGGQAAGRSSRFNQETGEFELRAPAGQYTLRAQAFAEGGVAGVAFQALSVKGDADGVNVVLNPPLTIPITVQTESVAVGKGGSGASSGQMGRGVMVFLRGESTNRVFAAIRGNSVRSDSQSEAISELHDVEPGTYWAEVHPQGQWYVKSAQCGDVDLLREKLTVGTSAPCSVIEVVMRNDGAKLKVSAAMEEGAAATVLVMPERAPRAPKVFRLVGNGEAMPGFMAGGGYGVIAGANPEATSGVSSASRTEEFSNLAPGDYRVLLVDDAGELEYTNPDAIAEYMSKASHVTLEAGQSASVNLELVRVKK